MTGGNQLYAFCVNLPGEDGCCRGAVTRYVGSLARNFLDHLRAHVFKLVFEFDFLGDSNAVFRDVGRAEGFVEHDISPLRPQCDGHRVGENVDTLQNRVSRIAIKFNDFSCHRFLLRFLAKVTSR